MIQYQVRPGDTLWGVAKQASTLTGVPVAWKDIAAASDIKPRDVLKLKPGTMLTIPVDVPVPEPRPAPADPRAFVGSPEAQPSMRPEPMPQADPANRMDWSQFQTDMSRPELGSALAAAAERQPMDALQNQLMERTQAGAGDISGANSPLASGIDAYVPKGQTPAPAPMTRDFSIADPASGDATLPVPIQPNSRRVQAGMTGATTQPEAASASSGDTPFTRFRQAHPEYANIADPMLAELMHRKFYAEMPRDEYYKRIGYEPPNAPGVMGKPGTWLNTLTGGLAAATDAGQQAATLNFSDELAGVIGGAGSAMKGESFAPGYDQARQAELDRLRIGQMQHPVASAAGTVGGALGTVGAAGSGGASLLRVAAPTAKQMIARGAIEGAGYGASAGAGAGDGMADRLKRAGVGAAVGAGIGAATGALGARMASKEAQKAVPSTDAIRQSADQFYKAADQTGLKISQKAYGGVVSDISNSVKAAGLDRTIHPKATAALSRLQEAVGTEPTLREVDTLRRVVGAAARSTDADERRVASIMINKIDDWLGKLKPADVVAGNAKQASSAIVKARSLWSQMRKSETLDSLITAAQDRVGANYTAAGFQTAIRQELKTLLRSPSKLRGFTADEVAAMRQVVRGGNVENLLRQIGKFAPRGIVSSALSGGAGYAVGGPAGSAALMGAGEAAKRASEAMGASNVARLSSLVRSGGQAPMLLPLTGRQNVALDALIGVGVPRTLDVLPLVNTRR